MEFRVDSKSGVPAYLQLVRQVRHAVRFAILEPGDQLPTVRDLVADLAINPNTVLKAYRELEHDGLVGARPGQGTFVVASMPGLHGRQLAGLRRSLSRWVDQARTAGLDDEGIASLLDDVLALGEQESSA